MSLNLIPIEQKESQLPRINKEFVGISHQLQTKKKQRRKVQSEERAVENRVLHLEKQQAKAQKDLTNKRRQLQKLLNIKERQSQESLEKNRLRMERMEELQRLKKHNEYMKMIHKSNLHNTIDYLKDRNKSDYSKIRKERIDGEYRKKVKKEEDLKEKHDYWISSNLSKQKGKMKVDNFYKERNMEHLEEYQSRLKKEDKKMKKKLLSMKDLEEKEEILREKVQRSIAKNGQLESLISHIERVGSPKNSRINELFEPKEQRKTINTQRMSGIQKRNSGQQEIAENIEVFTTEEKKQLARVTKRRKKNKHINRYKEYQAF